jgi:hypothetical protein
MLLFELLFHSELPLPHFFKAIPKLSMPASAQHVQMALAVSSPFITKGGLACVPQPLTHKSAVKALFTSPVLALAQSCYQIRGAWGHGSTTCNVVPWLGSWDGERTVMGNMKSK